MLFIFYKLLQKQKKFTIEWMAFSYNLQEIVWNTNWGWALSSGDIKEIRKNLS